VADSFQVLFGDDADEAEDAFYSRLASVEVEENADLPGAIQLLMTIGVAGAEGSEDLTVVGDAQFKPYGRIAVIATPDGGKDACIFDGYVLSQRIHVDRGTTAATLRVWGQDVSCLMNVKEVVKEWSDTTDGDIANDIFEQYGFETADDNEQDDSGEHTEDTQTVMQRATDAQFLRDRARRAGKLFRVCCADRPGANTGYFVTPALEHEPVVTLTLNPPGQANIEALDFEWDVARPSRVLAQVLLDSDQPETRNTRESGLALLDSRSLADFTGGDRFLMESRLTGAADSAKDLGQRAASLLREAGWFVRCEGEVDLGRLKAVLRAATVVQVDGAGTLHSGSYFVWSVRHTITPHSHRMRFVLVRNAVGAASDQPSSTESSE
jgi:hypothetical protein